MQSSHDLGVIAVKAGMPISNNRAYNWVEKAEMHKVPDAMRNIQSLRHHDTPTPIPVFRLVKPDNPDTC